ncbi:phosphonate metabolism transcriptional regulator PhnF [Ensifer soli]|uniref:phosphonate metabolism transcriptional regulator PhnF n=1 Tax=Ciceribacter sp. sgz301302 TaxID=3342379 RepID=UPI0035B9223D
MTAEVATERAMGIERQTGVALWRQIADRIRHEIAAGDYDGTGMMPAETLLAARFGVNRHTVRSALAALADEGLVRPIQGVGTLVERRARFSFPISRRTRFSAGLGNQAQDLTIRVIEHAVVPATPEVAAGLGLAAGAAVLRIVMTGTADGRPVSVATGFVDAGRFPRMAKEMERTGSVTRAFAAHGLDDYVRASTEIIARHADQAELDHLALSPGAIVLETRSVNVDADGRPVQYAVTRFAADRMRLTIES